MTLTLLFAAALLGGLVVKLWLSTRQIRHVLAHRGAVPPAFEGTVTLAAHQKAADYTVAKSRLGLWTTAFSTAVVLGWTLLGGLSWLNDALQSTLLPRIGPMGYQLALIGSVAAIGSVLDAPWSWYRTFRLEQRFGFNRMTWQLALADAVKGTVVAVVVGAPAAALVLWMMHAMGNAWWLWAWAAWVAFNLLFLVVYPTWIAPLFNTFAPLDNAVLRERVDGLLHRCGFAVSGFFVMDGSRRSAHGNAYFTGLGKSKRVVFFDTLLDKLTASEVVAVLAHELGHFKHRHVVKRMALMFGMGFVGLALLGWVSGKVWFYSGLGVMPSTVAPNDALALILLSLVAPSFLFFASPLFAAMSRRHEYEADAYACAQADGRELAQALLKLHGDNASTLTPDPAFVRFYYSHPPASARLAALTSPVAAMAGGPAAAV